jgi:hypothetical protein
MLHGEMESPIAIPSMTAWRMPVTHWAVMPLTEVS